LCESLASVVSWWVVYDIAVRVRIVAVIGALSMFALASLSWSRSCLPTF